MMRNNESAKDILYAAMVELGGGRFQGVQAGMPELGLEPLIMFCGPDRSTLGLPASKVSADAVRRRLAEKEIELELALA